MINIQFLDSSIRDISGSSASISSTFFKCPRNFTFHVTVQETLEPLRFRTVSAVHQYVPDYKINLVPVAFLDDETIAKFQSDFQIVAEFFKAKRLGNSKQLRYNKKKWDHVAELLDFFQTFSGQRKYEKIRQDVIERFKKEDTAMNDYDPLIEIWEEGVEEGARKGISVLIQTCQEFNRTKEEVLAKLMEKFDLTKDDANHYIQQYWI